MNILGNTIEEIAKEKCGIIKGGVPVISYPQEEKALEVIKERCNELCCNLEVVDTEDIRNIIIDKEKHVQKIEVSLEDEILKIDLGLLGDHQ